MVRDFRKMAVIRTGLVIYICGAVPTFKKSTNFWKGRICDSNNIYNIPIRIISSTVSGVFWPIVLPVMIGIDNYEKKD